MSPPGNTNLKLPRVVIVCDGEHWFTRRVAWAVHDIVGHDEMVYHCDKALGGAYKSIEEAVRALKRRYPARLRLSAKRKRAP